MLLVACLTFLLAFAVAELQEGDSCNTSDGTPGYCKLIEQCEKAKEELRNGRYPTSCGFKQKAAIVCCPHVPGSTQEKRKSVQKCEEYADYVYSVPDKPPYMVKSECLDVMKLIVGGVEAEPKEFPHMAIIGFGEKNSVKWLCAGSLISEKFVLSGAQCAGSRAIGHARWIRLGDLNIQRTDDATKTQDFEIIKTYRHPEYKAPSIYNDIALFELDRNTTFNGYVRPACLHTDESVPSRMVATGWGVTDYVESEASSYLLKVNLDYVDPTICNETLGPSIGGRRVKFGFTADTMVCAGDLNGGKDTCKGDSGGPLQVRLTKPYCMYDIVGITSVGSYCGAKNSPAIYTRVSHYVPWIESIVWP